MLACAQTGDVWSRTNFDAKRGKDGIDGTFGGTQEKYTSDQVPGIAQVSSHTALSLRRAACPLTHSSGISPSRCGIWFSTTSRRIA